MKKAKPGDPRERVEFSIPLRDSDGAPVTKATPIIGPLLSRQMGIYKQALNEASQAFFDSVAWSSRTLANQLYNHPSLANIPTGLRPGIYNRLFREYVKQSKRAVIKYPNPVIAYTQHAFTFFYNKEIDQTGSMAVSLIVIGLNRGYGAYDSPSAGSKRMLFRILPEKHERQFFDPERFTVITNYARLHFNHKIGAFSVILTAARVPKAVSQAAKMVCGHINSMIWGACEEFLQRQRDERTCGAADAVNAIVLERAGPILKISFGYLKTSHGKLRLKRQTRSINWREVDLSDLRGSNMGAWRTQADWLKNGRRTGLNEAQAFLLFLRFLDRLEVPAPFFIKAGGRLTQAYAYAPKSAIVSEQEAERDFRMRRAQVRMEQELRKRMNPAL